MALIGEDCSISLTLGVMIAGVITWGTPGTITGTARKISTDDSVELANTKAIGDLRKKHRAHSGSTRLEIENVTPYTGFQFLTSRVTPIGRPCKVSIKEINSLTLGQEFVGLIQNWKSEIAEGEPTIEAMTVMCDADGA